MGIKRIGYGDKYKALDWAEYICDTEADLELLPTVDTDSVVNGAVLPKCSAGSRAIVVESKKVYVLNTEGTWSEYIDYASGGGSGSGSGGGMPDASGLKNGTVMVAVNGEFVPVEGYAYPISSGKSFTSIWDGIYREADCFYLSTLNGPVKKISDENYGKSAEYNILVSDTGGESSFNVSHYTSMPGMDVFVYFFESESEGYYILDVATDTAWRNTGLSDTSYGVGIFIALVNAGEPEEGAPVYSGLEMLTISGRIPAEVAKINQDYIYRAGSLVYKGAKQSAAYLPQTDNEVGDVWHITADGSEWAWNGSEWEELGKTVDLSQKLDVNQGSSNAGKFLVVGSNGDVTPVTMQSWQGGSY